MRIEPRARKINLIERTPPSAWSPADDPWHQQSLRSERPPAVGTHARSTNHQSALTGVPIHG
jgi:hypothetical protein